ncbi:hypothetical protein ACFY1J_25065 [Streptomyces sp. NPDC001406]|uniref:hypothetical protein n=1 Tax=Streptomyces sp. NPDC001406 TaxID=3364572 RepID=UPI0036A4A2C6
MRLRVALGRYLSYGGQQYQQGDEFEVADESAAQWLRTGLVPPADGDWPDGIHSTPETARESFGH